MLFPQELAGFVRIMFDIFARSYDYIIVDVRG